MDFIKNLRNIKGYFDIFKVARDSFKNWERLGLWNNYFQIPFKLTDSVRVPTGYDKLQNSYNFHSNLAYSGNILALEAKLKAALFSKNSKSHFWGSPLRLFTSVILFATILSVKSVGPILISGCLVKSILVQ